MWSVCLLIHLHGSGVRALFGLSTEAVVHEMIAWLALIGNPMLHTDRTNENGAEF